MPPELARTAETCLTETSSWQQAPQFRGGDNIHAFQPLMVRVEKDQVEAMVEASKEEKATPVSGPLADEPIAAQIDFNTFAKVDLRVVRIVNAEHVEGADKLLRLRSE